MNKLSCNQQFMKQNIVKHFQRVRNYPYKASGIAVLNMLFERAQLTLKTSLWPRSS